ncbi:Uma2 family endonuclease [Streptomyces huiliensis]|uniref:Uma2 family endonuclease n=1 Tax=Streptomyces huiliensis TaxID=2876027 RepID=UPI001CBDE763|nr:Uma2 family endonuclease [Streptomyces huiliensis]MBZ4319721.1 Uma2 family endonuclease [Streptomyces huiliensis]
MAAVDHVRDGSPRQDSGCPRPRVPGVPGKLREVAEFIRETTGLRVEVIRGNVVATRTRSLGDALLMSELHEALYRCRSDGVGSFQNVSIGLPGDPDDFVTPLLVVCPLSVMNSDEWLLAGDEVELAVEASSPRDPRVGVADRIAWYAEARVPLVLCLRPADREWVLHARPSVEGYLSAARGRYGEPVPLPGRLGGDLPTEHLPRYTR